LTEALGDGRTAIRAAAAFASVLVCALAGLTRVRLLSRRALLIVAALAGSAGLAALLAHFHGTSVCVARYEGRPVIAGLKLQAYVKPEPGSSPSDLLFDAGGKADRVWTPGSIVVCRALTGWVGLMAIPFFAASAAYLLVAYGSRAAVAQAPPAARRTGAAVYDFFISYRHTEPDQTYAAEIVETLEKSGFRGAIDHRDFQPNEYVLNEMERSIRHSRLILCVVTKRYFESGFCDEEALITKTFDMAERRRRLVPLIFDRTEMPVWLHGIVGIDFTEAATTDPMERLHACLRDARAAASSGTRAAC
jgi:hypothetical protein